MNKWNVLSLFSDTFAIPTVCSQWWKLMYPGQPFLRTHFMLSWGSKHLSFEGGCISYSGVKKVWTTEGCQGMKATWQHLYLQKKLFNFLDNLCSPQGMVLAVVSRGFKPDVLPVWVCQQEQLQPSDQSSFICQPRSLTLLQIRRKVRSSWTKSWFRSPA